MALSVLISEYIKFLVSQMNIEVFNEYLNPFKLGMRI